MSEATSASLRSPDGRLNIVFTHNEDDFVARRDGACVAAGLTPFQMAWVKVTPNPDLPPDERDAILEVLFGVQGTYGYLVVGYTDKHDRDEVSALAAKIWSGKITTESGDMSGTADMCSNMEPLTILTPEGRFRATNGSSIRTSFIGGYVHLG